MQPDVEAAKKFLSSAPNSFNKFGPYSSAYTTTNENLRHAYEFMTSGADDVLSVAASGDHPLFAKFNGAKNIDTFDISYNAKCIMDIKTAALHTLTYPEYNRLLTDLWYAMDVKKVKNMDKVLDLLQFEERDYLVRMHGYRLFDHGLGNLNKYRLTEPEFNKMREIVNVPFNFIWSDITSVHHYLNKQYDFIHLSNIFDSLDEDTRIYILSTMMRYVKPDGVLCFQSCKNIPMSVYDYCNKLEQENKSRWNLERSKTDSILFIMQRTH